jgi:Tfp pilus assembly major pilin PilA
VLSVLIALHIIISLTVIGIKYVNNKHEIKHQHKTENGKLK